MKCHFDVEGTCSRAFCDKFLQACQLPCDDYQQESCTEKVQLEKNFDLLDQDISDQVDRYFFEKAYEKDYGKKWSDQ